MQPVLGLLAVELGLAEVDEHEVHVGAAREDVHAPASARGLVTASLAGLQQLLGDGLRARHGALLALLEDVGLRRS